LPELSDQTGDGNFSEIGLNRPPDTVPNRPPVNTRTQILPFGELTWENFERLCYRLAGRAQRVEHVARYGRPGQAEQGIDLFVRTDTDKYEVWQAKRYESISPGDVRAAADKFRAGAWKNKTEKLILAVQAALTHTKVQDEIEVQAAAFKAEGISFIPHGGEELSLLLKSHPDLVDDFFGRGWVESFFGLEVTKTLGQRLDGAEFVRVRSQIKNFYDVHFHLLDVGVVLPLNFGTGDHRPSMLDRFVVPDVLIQDTVSDEQLQPPGFKADASSSETAKQQETNGGIRLSKFHRLDYVRRTSLPQWLTNGSHLAILGEAGSGKSTVLRCIALDLLTGQGVFPLIARRWGELLPIHISFSKWSRLSTTLGRAASLKEVVAAAMQPALTADLVSLLDRAIDEKRVLLLLDGLDEWSDEQAARTTLQHVLAFVSTHHVSTVTAARPRGLDKIGTIPPSWRTARLAPLCRDQQRELARVWFSSHVTRSSPADSTAAIDVPIEARTDRFFAELARDPGLLLLAANPLLLVGLVALSIRQIALPRNRMQAIQRLVSILIETHPEGWCHRGRRHGRSVYPYTGRGRPTRSARTTSLHSALGQQRWYLRCQRR
jgi:hypothetical protein